MSEDNGYICYLFYPVVLPYFFLFNPANSPPTLTVTSGMSIVLEAGMQGYVNVTVSDSDPGDTATLHIAPLNSTECLTLDGNDGVYVMANVLADCNIA